MSTLNQYLLKHCLDNGATSSDLNSAQVQALRAQGATGSTLADLWMSYLSAQGQTSGTHADRLGALLASKGYVGTLNDKLLAAARANDIFGFKWSALFSKYGATSGFVYSGLRGQSNLFIDSAMTTPCGANGDPLGGITDISGLGNNAVQPTSFKKFSYMTDGTTKYWTTSGGVLAALLPQMDVILGAGSYTVFALVSSWVGNFGSIYLFNAKPGSFDPGGQLALRSSQGTRTSIDAAPTIAGGITSAYNDLPVHSWPTVVVMQRVAGVTVSADSYNILQAHDSTFSQPDPALTLTYPVTIGDAGGFQYFYQDKACFFAVIPAAVTLSDRLAAVKSICTLGATWNP